MTTAKWVRAFLIVPAELLEAANVAAGELDFDEGADTFTVPLSADGTGTPTHYGASTLMRPRTLEVVESQLIEQFKGALLYSGDQRLAEVLADAGLAVVVGG